MAYAKLRGNGSEIRFSEDKVEAMFSAERAPELRCVEESVFSEGETVWGVLSNVNGGDTFLDVGSNLGLFTIFAAKFVGPEGAVLAFEPETVAHGRLTRGIRLNGLHNVRVFKLALSETRASRKLVLGNPDALSQLAHLTDDPGPVGRLWRPSNMTR